MRELKFRAWDKKAKQYLILDRFQFTCDERGEIKYIYGAFSYGHPCGYKLTDGDGEQLDVEQFTGWLDKNGKEIYEGDILDVESCIDEEEITRYEVYWDEYALEYALRVIKGVNYDSCVGELSPSAVSVIGNIHENPELLGE